MRKRESWVIYSCRGCGEGVFEGRTRHRKGCVDRRFEEIVVVRASDEKVEAHRKNPTPKREPNPFTQKARGKKASK